MKKSELLKALEDFGDHDDVFPANFFADGTTSVGRFESVCRNGGAQLNVELINASQHTAFPREPLQEIIERIDELHAKHPTGDWAPAEVSQLLVAVRRRVQEALGEERTALAKEHDELVHSDGSTCEDGCDAAPVKTT